MVVSVKQCLIAALLCAATLGCGDPAATATSAESTAKSSGGAPASVPSGSAGQTTARPSSEAPPSPKSDLQGAWTSAFKTERAKVTLDPGVSDKAWASDKGETAVGDGTLELSIAENGTVKGSLKGSLGDLVLHGMADGDHVNGTFTAAQPEPATFSGTVELTKKGDALEGELRASSGDAKLVRRATLSLKKK